MGRRAFIISLFAFLAFAISVAELSEEIIKELDLNDKSFLEPFENVFRLAGRLGKGSKKQTNGTKKKGKKLKRNKGKGLKRRVGKKNKRRSKNNKRRKTKLGSKRRGKGKKKNGRRRKKSGVKSSGSKKNKQAVKRRNKDSKSSGRKRKKYRKIRPKNDINKARQTCDEKELCKRIKLYIKYFNQERKAKRILRTCKTMKNKAAKADAFQASADAIQSSEDAEVAALNAKLSKCAETAKASCASTNVAQCADAEQTKISECAKKMRTWLDAFGPGASSCLGKDNCCACINSISPAVPDECVSYDAIDKAATQKKNKCTKNESNGGGKGSFGECRKQQYTASVKGNQQSKKCKGKGKTTAAVKGGRRMVALLSSKLKSKLKRT